MPADAVFCTHCGTDLETGRRLVEHQAWDKADEGEKLASGWLRFISIFLPFNLMPYESEVPVRRRPTALMCIVALAFLCYPLLFLDWSETHLMSWGGDPSRPQPQPPDYPPDAPPWNPPVGRFAWWQLVTAQFMHANLDHLVFNMSFLLVFGPKVNEVLGNLGFTLVYLGLGAVAGLGHLYDTWGEPATPGLGASGSAMVVAGMYLIFCPQHRVRIVAWLRLFLFTPLFCWPFRVRGVILVCIFLALDLLPMFLGAKDNVGHTVHLLGFFVGASLAAMLVATRAVRCGGYDLLSWCFGQQEIEADAAAGKPVDDRWAAISNHPAFLVAVVLAAVVTRVLGWLLD